MGRQDLPPFTDKKMLLPAVTVPVAELLPVVEIEQAETEKARTDKIKASRKFL
jgi:hypothetical protein